MSVSRKYRRVRGRAGFEIAAALPALLFQISRPQGLGPPYAATWLEVWLQQALSAVALEFYRCLFRESRALDGSDRQWPFLRSTKLRARLLISWGSVVEGRVAVWLGSPIFQVFFGGKM